MGTDGRKWTTVDTILSAIAYPADGTIKARLANVDSARVFWVLN